MRKKSKRHSLPTVKKFNYWGNTPVKTNQAGGVRGQGEKIRIGGRVKKRLKRRLKRKKKKFLRSTEWR